MSRHYPIWVDIDSCIYNSKKSYGVRDHSSQNIKVGTSAKNSHDFATVSIDRIQTEDGTVFRLQVDGVTVKKGMLNGTNLKFI